MKRKNTEYRKCCALCEKSTSLETGDFLCSKKGVVSPDGVCRRFRFDLIKHNPQAKRELPEFTPVSLDD